MLLSPARANRARRKVSRAHPMPFPVEGWDASSPLQSMPERRAVQLKNWFPQPGWGEVRRGHRYHAWNLGTSTTTIETLMAWRGPASSKMFAAGGGVIYDVTSRAAGSSAVTSLSSNRWQWVNFTTSAGSYLWACNGTDTCRHYNGTTWAAPSLTGVTSSDVIHVNAHKKRLWLIVKDSTKAYYLSTEAVAGAATAFELGSVFTRGGYVNAMATWTRDGGSGADDVAVFISSEGQCAVYAGTDPASASTWELIGVFNVPRPIGRRCFAGYGADVLLLTRDGVFPLSKLLPVDQSAAPRVAISETIANALASAARSYAANFGWEICVYPRGTRVIVNIPITETSRAVQYVMNSLTGAWCEFEGMNANCWLAHNEQLFFGGNDGKVYEADYGSADIDTPITAVGQSAYSAFGAADIKHFKMVRPLVTISGLVRPSVGISIDFSETSTLSATTGSATGGAQWDSARWDSGVWGGGAIDTTEWAGAIGIGTFGSVKFQARTGVDAGGSGWGISLWGSDLWGSAGTADETMRINGFLVVAEAGGLL